MDSIQLSIIVPVYNSEKYLKKCIGSILDQTFKNFELILIDDASTDTSGEICDQMTTSDNRIRVIHHEKNKGLSLSREDGVKAACGQWISFVDNDDLVCPVMYEKLMGQTDRGEMICIRGEDRSSEEIEQALWDIQCCEPMVWTGQEACELIYSKSLDLGFIEPVWGKIIKKTLIEKVLDEVEKYKEQLHWVFMEDVLFTPLLFYYADKVVFNNVLMYMHRRILNNLSSTLIPKEYHYEAVDAGDVLLSFFKENKLNKAFDKYLLGFFMLVLSTWYKVWKNEENEEKKQEFDIKITNLYIKYDKDISQVKTKGAYEMIEKAMVLFFSKHRVLWGRTVGRLYFEVGRRLTY